MDRESVSEMPALTVITFLWRGWRPGTYRPEHVHALRRMVADHLTIPHRFLCICDKPRGLDCDTMPFWRTGHVRNPPEAMNSYRRLRLFAPEMREAIGTEWVLQMDLDTLVVDSLDPLITWDDLKMVAGTMAPYNGSMWLHRLGSRPQLWEEFNPRVSPQEVHQHGLRERRAHRLSGADGKPQPYRGSDQAWIGYKCPDEPVWTAEDGVIRVGKKRRGEPVPEGARILFFPGVPKPWTRSAPRSFDRDLVARYAGYLQRRD
jgi:hypothetical protein